MRRDIDPRLLRLEDLPTLPEVMSRILEAASNTDTSAQQLASLLEMDHVISARVLRLANSAYFGLSRSVDTVHRAVVVLGFDSVRSLALATSVFGNLARNRPTAFDPREFWLHSLGTATAAKLVAEKSLPGAGASCFTAGLLHDIGKYVMALQLGDDYGEIVETARREALPLPEVERTRLGASHTEVGRWVARKWCFPTLLVDVISHLYEFDSYGGPYIRELAAVTLADSLSHQAGIGDPVATAEPVPPGSVLNTLGLELESLEGVSDRVRESVDEAADLFQILRDDGR